MDNTMTLIPGNS